MANYIGSAKEVDHYIGNNLVAAKYIGENKYFDAYSEIEGNLPLAFEARVAYALKNYRIYGTAAGSGTATESGEPAGYKIPISLTDGTSTSNYDLYVGSTKLGEDEYLDFAEQKIYKDVSGTLTPTDPPVAFPAITTYLGENTLSSTETVGNVTVKGRINKPLIYGFHIDPSKSDPAQAVTYLADAVGMTPAAMGAETFSYGSWEDAFFMPKPCMLKFDGTVDYYLDPDDYTKKTDGTAANIYQQEVNGNAMMEWPLIWYKFEAGEAPGEGYFYCSDQQVDSDYKCWCNINSQGQQIPHFYTSIYNCYSTNSHQKLRSLSGKSLVQGNHGMLTAQQEITSALANNTTNAVEWYTAVFADRQLISALLILISKTLDNQRAFGRGRVKIGANANANKTFKEAYQTGGTGGTLDHKGLFYGSLSNDETAVKVFGMENWWGEAFTRTAGLVSVNGKYMYKLTYGTADGSTASAYNLTGTDYLEGGNRPSTSQQNVQQMSFGAWGFLPSVTASDPNYETYYCESIYSGYDGYALFGGGVGEGYAAGATYLNIENSTALSYFTVGTCLSCKPIVAS